MGFGEDGDYSGMFYYPWGIRSGVEGLGMCIIDGC